MKSVGQQLQEARQAKNWTPELAARETKIKVERVRDLEADDYTHFSSPTYARGFVRTYARALGLDEYRLLRQLDNKLPEDDNASFAQDNGLPYVPDTSKTTAMHVSSAPRTGLYIVLGLGCAIVFIISFVMVQAYRAGELQRYFADTSSDSLTNSAPNASAIDSQTPMKASAVDPNDTSHSAKAVAVDLSTLPAGGAPPVAAQVVTAPAGTPVAVAVNNSTPTTGAPPAVVATSDTPPVAVAVNPVAPPATPAPATTAPATPAPASSATGPITPAPSANTDTVNLNPTTTPAPASTNTVANIIPPADTNAVVAPATTNVTVAPTPAPAAPEEKPIVTTSSARASNVSIVSTRPAPVEPATTPAPAPTTAPVVPVRAQAVDPSVLMAANQSTPPASSVPVAPQPEVTTAVDLGNGSSPAPAFVDAHAAKRLVLTASSDSFIRVTSLDTKQVLYSSVLRSGQSMAFDGRKFSVSVNKPSVVDIMLDGVDYGPHSEGNSPETFTLQSHEQ